MDKGKHNIAVDLLDLVFAVNKHISMYKVVNLCFSKHSHVRFLSHN